eukprot:CAMPEP_0168629004 /NCGR_PEP_ID=MMETSP0449_2-20121227/12152_1 /TAXON_ID=1082188 /ORGANISM="Strombidium rassoulzadegani, Strain ras09" /LENGTH=215 /DNA_ID=CAMNT_0008671473 /DNA_START=113 /DNA_END=760 /DNA_ORIENTATION=+
MSVWSQVTDEQVRKIRNEFIIDIILLALCIYLLELSMTYQKNCGIPVKQWLMGFFIIYFSRSSFQLLKIWVVSSFYDYRTCYDFSAFALCNGVMLGWLVYGYIIFFSEANNCDDVPDTALLNSVMFVILFIGYIMIFIYMMLLCTLPCVYMFVREEQDNNGRGAANARNGRNMPNSQIPGLLASLSKTHYDANKFKHETNCVICLVDYEPRDVVT